MSNYAHPESLVSTQWVAEHLNNPLVRLVEIVWGDNPAFGKPSYESKHIPGAVAWDFEKDLQDTSRRDVVNRNQVEALLGRSGISPEMTIIVYSGVNNQFATYTFWLLKIYGHRDIRLMDGDRQKWLDENRSTESTAPAIIPVVYHAAEPDWSLRANRQDVLAAIGGANHILLDARSAEMYDGRNKASAARGGHIPGAINLAAKLETNSEGEFQAWRVQTVGADGMFKPVEELRSLFAQLGVTPEKEIITYCVRGGLSTHAWFVLTQLLGYGKVREYDRSWLEWGNLEGMPIEQ